MGHMEAEDVMTRSAEPPDAVLRYAGHDDGLVDVHVPAGPTRPRPLVFFVHGGFWRQEYDRRHARPLANALADAGYVVALPEYRRVGGAGGWPTTADDVEAALAATPDLLAGIGVPTATTTLVGHSAGGHLVLWLANQPGRLLEWHAQDRQKQLRGARLVEPTGQGSCRFTEVVEVRLLGLLRPLDPLVAWLLHQQATADLRRLKHLLETPPASSGPAPEEAAT